MVAKKRSSQRFSSTGAGKSHSARPKGSSRRGAKVAPTDTLPRGCRLVVGVHSVSEALKVRPNAVMEIWVSEERKLHAELGALLEKVERAGQKIKEKSAHSLSQFCQTHQGIAAVVKEKPELDWQELGVSTQSEIIIALDEIVDPHNVGAILRTAWLMGVRALIVSELRSSPLTPTVSKVACGGAEHLPLISVGNLGQALSDLKTKGFWIYGLAGEEGSKNLWDEEYPAKMVWVVGSEAKGLRPSVRKQCDQIISIPQIDADASYNASVAVALALSESKRQARDF